MIQIKNVLENSFCPVCFSKKYKHKFLFRRKSIKVLKKNKTFNFNFTNYICKKCDFVFNKKYPSDITLNNYYKYYPGIFEVLDDYSINSRLRLIKSYKNKKILCVGETEKKFLNSLKKKHQVTISNIKNKKFLKKKYDIIFCFFVLEHVSNINIFIKSLKLISKKNTILFIEVPDTKNYFSESFEGEHLSHFDQNNLIFFIEKNYGQVLKTFKTKYYGIGVKAINSSRLKSKTLLKQNSSYLIYKKKYKKYLNMVKKFKFSLIKLKVVGFTPINQYFIDIMHTAKNNKKYLFDNFKKKILDFKIYNFKEKSILNKCDKIFIMKTRHKKVIEKELKSNIKNHNKIVNIEHLFN